MSGYNLELKSLYIHIPKTAGTSMEAVYWIGKGFNKHEPVSYFYEQSKNAPDGELDLDKFYKWTFVRNPYHRFMSGVINHVLKGRFIELGEEGKRNHEIIKDEVTKFILKHGAGYDYPRHAQPNQTRETNFNRFGVLKRQIRYVTLEDKSINVMDFCGRFENLEEDWAKLCEHFGRQPTRLPHRVKGFKIDYDSLYTPETREIIYNYYKPDFEMFGYEE